MDLPDGPDYLRLPISWSPSRRLEHGEPCEYRLVLGADEVAILQRVAGKGWALTIIRGPERAPAERGLFGTIVDAVMVLYAEFSAGGARECRGSSDQLVGSR